MMASISDRVRLILDLSPAEFSLIGKALTGRLTSKPLQKEALELNKHLMTQRVEYARKVLEAVLGPAEQADELIALFDLQSGGDE
jgi:hypothetical protein